MAKFEKNHNTSIDDVNVNPEMTACIDFRREKSPLRKATDAIEPENTSLSIN